eukprot:GHVT01025871.1.p3 GENE.GHVT01025871.1~~GHVT01025871.1.p3  ORF type:complete len:110 (+),score=16.51 GHVT01025871.1:1047-1376(+)
MDSTDEISQGLDAATLLSANSDSATESGDGSAPQRAVDRFRPEMSPGKSEEVEIVERSTVTLVPAHSKMSNDMIKGLQLALQRAQQIAVADSRDEEREFWLQERVKKTE